MRARRDAAVFDAAALAAGNEISCHDRAAALGPLRIGFGDLVDRLRGASGRREDEELRPARAVHLDLEVVESETAGRLLDLVLHDLDARGVELRHALDLTGE